MWRLFGTFSWQELRHHPWRSASAVVAVMLGVALAFGVHLINASALAEFASAVASVNGQPDLRLRARQGTLDDRLLDRVMLSPAVSAASPVLELSVPVSARGDDTRPQTLRLIGVDALSVAAVSPALLPRRGEDTGEPDRRSRLDLFAPDAVFLNAGARQLLGIEPGTDARLWLWRDAERLPVRVAGTVAAGGEPLAVMDVAALQDLMERPGELSRIDLRLMPGRQPGRLPAQLGLPAHVLAEVPEQTTERASNLSRAYRINLTVLALVALFTGAFLVFSVLSLSVARRQQQFALLGVLGLSARERLRLVLAESALLGLMGSLAGIALGTALAALALDRLGGDLGGGYFSGAAPPLQWSLTAALVYGGLGLVAALAGGWWPAQATARMAPALALKGLGLTGQTTPRHHRGALALIVLAALLAWAPPVAGVPVAAYVSVGLLLVGGIAALPLAVGALLDRLAPRVARHALPLLAVERSRRLRETAAVATSGVVASLALSVALTVMVASFRDSVTRWLDAVLPAQLYVRSAGGAVADSRHLPPDFIRAVQALPGVDRVDALRATPVQFDPARPPVTLLARPLHDMGERAQVLPLVGDLRPAGPDADPEVVEVYVSEAMVDLYGARPGQPLPVLGGLFPGFETARFHVAGVWRDYGRQHGSIAMDRSDFVRLTGDARVNDLALHLDAGATEGSVREDIERIADRQGLQGLVEFASAGQIRATSLRIFDRSFAVTVWLQGVAIGIGLFGVAASFSAQVLARRREFGLLAHLGLTRRQILGVVALEGLAWTALGALAGLALGLAVSLVLVHVVNPQSFHWTMDLVLPWLRLLALCAGVIVAGTVTAWLAGQAAASRDAVRAVKEDW
ncbi:MAG: FtsX-like permease family protein [Burkholderiales bacterium]|nr:MAG: FtsX-like permease family protein [Burkholderiales bacterium]